MAAFGGPGSGECAVGGRLERNLFEAPLGNFRFGLAPFLQEELIFLDEACEFETGADAAVVEGGAGVAGYGIVLNLDDGFIAKGIRLVLLKNDARPLPVKGLLSACTCGAYRG